MHVNKTQSDKVIYEQFSRITKKNDFSFEALEVLSHIFFLLKNVLKHMALQLLLGKYTPPKSDFHLNTNVQNVN